MTGYFNALSSRVVGTGLAILAMAVALTCPPPGALAQGATLRVFSAGSTRGALTAMAQDYETKTGQKIELNFGPAGLLRQRIETSGGADVFISANMEHPQALARLGKMTPPVVFANNKLCATGRASLALTSETLLDKLLDPSVKIGASTPGADPGGDYAWQLFAQAEALRPGSKAILEAKTKQLVGGPDSPKIPAGEDALHYFMAQNQTDVFIGYCSSHSKVAEPAENTGIPVSKVETPKALAFPIRYGLSVAVDGSDTEQQNAALRFALYLLSPEAQQLLPDYGFLLGGG